jgi:predicted Zn-dependent peptidase
MMDRTVSPEIKDAIEFDVQLKPYEKFALDNGIQVYTIDAGAQDVLQIEWVFYAGNVFEKNNGIAHSTNNLLKNGTSGKTAFQINEHFDYYGAHCTRACYNETATVSLHTLSKHLKELLPVIREILTDSIFPESELEIFKQNSKQKLSVNLKKCDFVAGRLIDTYLFGKDHPYGKFLAAEDYDAITIEMIKKFYYDYYINGHCIIFVSGKIPADIQQQLNSQFGSLPLQIQKPVIEQHKIVSSEQKKFRIQNEENGVQGAIRIARLFPNRHHPDFKAATVLNALFGGFFGSRLMSNIREDKGYTYGISSYLQNYIEQSAWMISTEAGKDVCEATIEEVYKEMKILKEELVDEEELLLVKNYLIGGILGDLDGPFQIIARWKNIILNNLDEKYFYDSINVIKTVTAEELKELANKYFKEEEFYELVVI